jgi:two-component system response regulator YesN
MDDAPWKVIIADDEPIIREGIREAVDWDALGFAVAGEAEDGEEALELAVRHSVDLMLVDLNMPILNGIDLIRELKERLPQCRIVIVTGHDEFGYAQQAIRYGVDEYILKPANPGHLTDTLRKIAFDLKRSKEQEKHLALASRQIRKNIPLLRERFCNEWIEGAVGREEALEQLAFLDLPRRGPGLIGVLRWLETDSGTSARTERDRQLMLFAMENIADEVLEKFPRVLFRDSLGFLCAIVWDTSDPAVFATVEQAVNAYLKLLVVAQAEPIEGMDGVPAAYRKARSGVYKESAVSPLVRRARHYIWEHYGDSRLSLEETAQAVGVSSVYLSRLFKQELGTTFVAFLTQTRVSKAIQLLNATSLTVAEIAEAVGYESQHYFSTAFKKAAGVSPIRYRKGRSPEEVGSPAEPG